MKSSSRLRLVEDVGVTSGTNESCVVLLGEEATVLSFDAAYELALRLAEWIQTSGEEQQTRNAH